MILTNHDYIYAFFGWLVAVRFHRWMAGSQRRDVPDDIIASML